MSTRLLGVPRVLFLFCFIPSSNQALGNPLRPLLSHSSLLCVCIFHLNCFESEREDERVEGRLRRSRIELDPDY